MKNLTSTDLKDYQLIETPPLILGKLLGGDRPIYESAIRSSSILPTVTAAKVIYLPDFLHAFPNQLDSNEKQMLVGAINKIRKAINGHIGLEFPDLLDLSFSKNHIKKDDSPKLNWIPIGENTGLIYKLSRVKREFQVDYPDFNHPNLAVEAIRKISSSQVLTIAPFYKNLRTLRDQFFCISSSQKLSAIIQALQGNLQLHQLGLAHGDIKQDNIYFLDTPDHRLQVKLGDLEGVMPISSKQQPGMVTNTYYEYNYYPDQSLIFDQQSDLFAWGTLLAEICSKFNLIEYNKDFQKKREKGLIISPDDLHKKLIAKILKDWRNQFPYQLLEIITRLMTPRVSSEFKQKPDFRGTLPQLINELTAIQQDLEKEEERNRPKTTAFTGILNLTKLPASS